MTGVYDPKAFILHAASLCQACAHCKRSSTAASRRSLGSVSVPVRLTILSDQLPVIALVGRYLTNKLIGRGFLLERQVLRSPPLVHQSCDQQPYPVLAHLSAGYPKLKGRLPTRSSPLRHFHPKYIAISRNLVRLACLIHAASVRSEPESNSPKKNISIRLPGRHLTI